MRKEYELKSNNKKLLLFDFDGVIMDSIDTIHVAYNKVHATYNLPYAHTKEEVRKNLEKNFFQSLLEYGLTQEQIDDYFYDIKKEIHLLEHYMQPFPGIDTLLAQVASLHTCAIITSGHRETVTRLLKRYDLQHYFSLILGAEDNKSKVVKIKKALMHFGVDKENTYFMTDTSGDISEGKEAGVTTIGVTWGYHNREKLEQAEPNYLFDTVSQLERFLLNI